MSFPRHTSTMKTLQQLPPNRRRVHHLFLGDEERLFYEDWEHDPDYEEPSSQYTAMETNPDEYQSEILNNASLTDVEIEELKTDVQFFSQPDGKLVPGFDAGDPLLGPLPTVHDDVEYFDQTLLAAIDKIIVMSQDTLLLLCLYLPAVPFAYTIDFSMPCALPNLVELTLCSSQLDRASFTSSHPPRLATLFSSLQKLYVDARCDVRALKQFLAIAPHLRYLRAQFDMSAYYDNSVGRLQVEALRGLFSKALKDCMKGTGLEYRIYFGGEPKVKQGEYLKFVHWDDDPLDMAKAKTNWLRSRRRMV